VGQKGKAARPPYTLVIPLFLALVVLSLLPAWGVAPQAPLSASIPTDPDLKVAFIGDTANGTSITSVLSLINSEGAYMVLHQWDFDYGSNPTSFISTIDTVLGVNFPYLASIGNHDTESWNTGCSDADGCYAQLLKDRMARIGIEPDDPDLNDQMYSATYRGLKVVFVGQNGVSAGDNTYAPYIQRQLAADDHSWKICSWHKDQNAMQVGSKGDEMGWKVYETCKNLGAIIATAHEHSYHRTKTLTSIQNQIVDSSCPDPRSLCVAKGTPGKSFVFVSGLGGNSVRDQARCLPSSYPYGCKGEWASIYTSTQGATFGALFIVFRVNGDPNRAHGYFKNIDGQIIDEFDIAVDGSARGIPAAPSGLVLR